VSQYIPLPAIFGVAGHVLNDEERAFFCDVKPFGYILFARNVDGPEQVKALVADLLTNCGTENAVVFIDQEGGRVARLRPPAWEAYPPAAIFGELSEQDRVKGARAAYLNARLIADDLYSLGIRADCLPVLDLPARGAHDIIGDRAFNTDPFIVSNLGQAVCDGLMDGGVLPVIKHIPGHGRAMADSHESLPVVDAEPALLRYRDFATFKALADKPFAMTAHIVYADFDDRQPATTSPRMIHNVIRDESGFSGVLMSDDLDMKALKGTLGRRAKASQQAGCDLVLHCSGDLDAMKEVADALEPPSEISCERFALALNSLSTPMPMDRAIVKAERDALIREVTG
jgi:beta-N-acetylhexosaminidase